MAPLSVCLAQLAFAVAGIDDVCPLRTAADAESALLQTSGSVLLQSKKVMGLQLSDGLHNTSRSQSLVTDTVLLEGSKRSTKPYARIVGDDMVDHQMPAVTDHVGEHDAADGGSGLLQIKAAGLRTKKNENDCNTCVLSGWGPLGGWHQHGAGHWIEKPVVDGEWSPDGQWTLLYIDKYGYKVFAKPDGSRMFYNAAHATFNSIYPYVDGFKYWDNGRDRHLEPAAPKEDVEDEESVDLTDTDYYSLTPEYDPDSRKTVYHRYWVISSSRDDAYEMHATVNPPWSYHDPPVRFKTSDRNFLESATMMCTLQQCGVALNMSVYENWKHISQNTECVCGVEPEAVEIRGKCDHRKGAIKAKKRGLQATIGHNCTHICDESDDCNYYTSFKQGYCSLWSVCDFDTMITEVPGDTEPWTYKK